MEKRMAQLQTYQDKAFHLKWQARQEEHKYVKQSGKLVIVDWKKEKG